MLVGGAAMLARSFGGLDRLPTRLEQSRQAKAIAEAGLARTIEGLNRNYNYLLINCFSQSGSAPPQRLHQHRHLGRHHRCLHPSAPDATQTERLL